ncbi:MAG: hypothetical protein HKN76_07000 [Saprospiraceae bacterium]|nr:hypothetical protein [Saprospiraceae bacterium]
MKIVILATMIIFASKSTYEVISSSSNRALTINDRLEISKYLKGAIVNNGFFVIRPEWIWGPAPEYGLIFGLSYVRHRDRYAKEVGQIYPNILSFEGIQKPFWNMRVSPVSDSLLIAEGKPILVVDQKGRDADPIILEIEERLNYVKDDSVVINQDMTLFTLSPKSTIDGH